MTQHARGKGAIALKAVLAGKMEVSLLSENLARCVTVPIQKVGDTGFEPVTSAM